MAKLLATFKRLVMAGRTVFWPGRPSSRRRVLLGVAALLLGSIGVWFAWPHFTEPAYCEGICQCWYCDDFTNGVCTVDGHPSGPIGCAGACAYNDRMPWLPPTCSQYNGVGGCGYVVACRAGDCPARGGGGAPTPTPTPLEGIPPTAVPTPTATPRPIPPIPAACGDLAAGEVREWTNLIPPTIAEPEIEPEHIVTIGQDPDKRGFRIHLVFTGGRYEYRTQRLEQWCGPAAARFSQGRYGVRCTGDVEWHYECPVRCTECYDDPLALAQIHMRLADSSKAWIETELAARYPGTRPLENLPHTWDIAGTKDQMRYDAWWAYKPGSPEPASTGPIDPGVHGGRIVLTTKGTPKSAPQTAQAPYEAKVFLLDTTIAQ